MSGCLGEILKWVALYHGDDGMEFGIVTVGNEILNGGTFLGL